MKTQKVIAVTLSLVLLTAFGSAQAAGCLKGAVVGGVAGHVAGHHAVLGAVGGCVVGHHLAKEKERATASQRAAPIPSS
jgi:outer membrane lipoprotein SlyB